MEKLEANEWINNTENIYMIKYIADQDEREHTHGFIEMEYIWQGCGYQVINGASIYVERGDLLFFNFGDRHSFKPTGKMGIINCILNPQFVSEKLLNSENALDLLTLSCFNEFFGDIQGILPKIKFMGKDLIEIESLMEFMLSEFDCKASGYLTVLKGYTNVLLTKVLRAFKNSDKVSFFEDMNKIAPNVLKFIEDNYNKKLMLSELAQIGFYNPSYFSRIFKECYGKTVTEYINNKRIDAAMHLLSNTDKTVENVFLEVGYKDKKQFYNLFKNYTNMTPDKYRSNFKKYPTNNKE